MLAMKCSAFGRCLILFTFTSAALVIGCAGDPNKPKLGKVSGKVTYKGQPVTKGAVSFVPTGGAGTQSGQSALGEIGPDGSYTLTTFQKGDGAVLGQHTVTVQAREENPEIEGKGMPIPDAKGQVKIKPAKSLIPEKYATTETSPLRFTIQEGNNVCDIELKD
jgi:hypothetical protein